MRRDVGNAMMKIVLTIAILLIAARDVWGDYAPPASSGVIVTGAWQFVHADGSITNGSWTHENVDHAALTSHEHTEYSEQSGKTGLLVVWWGRDRRRRCTVAEYRDGKENGYYIHWYPTGEIKSCGIMMNGCWLYHSIWYTNGIPAEVRIPPKWFNWKPDGTKEGKSPTR